MKLPLLRQLLPSATRKEQLTPGQKTQTLLHALTDQTLQQLVAQREVFFSSRRTFFIRTLAENLKEHWIPEGLSAADMEQIPLDWFIGMVSAVFNGTGLSGYEERLYAHFSQIGLPASAESLEELPAQERRTEAVDVPAVPEPERRDSPTARRRSYPRRRVS